MLADLLNQPCTIIRRQPTGEVDRYRNPVMGEIEIETVCELQQASRPEDTEAGTIASAEFRLFLLPTDTIDVNDVVVVAGTRYEVKGDPWEARNPRTREFEHIEATVTVTQGEGA